MVKAKVFGENADDGDITGAGKVTECEKETTIVLQRRPHHQIDTKIGGLAKVIKCSF